MSLSGPPIRDFDDLEPITMTITASLGLTEVNLAAIFNLLPVTTLVLPPGMRFQKKQGKIRIPLEYNKPGEILSMRWNGYSRGISRSETAKSFPHAIIMDVGTEKQIVSLHLSQSMKFTTKRVSYAKEAYEIVANFLRQAQADLEMIQNNPELAEIVWQQFIEAIQPPPEIVEVDESIDEMGEMGEMGEPEPIEEPINESINEPVDEETGEQVPGPVREEEQYAESSIIEEYIDEQVPGPVEEEDQYTETPGPVEEEEQYTETSDPVEEIGETIEEPIEEETQYTETPGAVEEETLAQKIYQFYVNKTAGISPDELETFHNFIMTFKGRLYTGSLEMEGVQSQMVNLHFHLGYPVNQVALTEVMNTHPFVAKFTNARSTPPVKIKYYYTKYSRVLNKPSKGKHTIEVNRSGHCRHSGPNLDAMRSVYYAFMQKTIMNREYIQSFSTQSYQFRLEGPGRAISIQELKDMFEQEQRLREKILNEEVPVAKGEEYTMILKIVPTIESDPEPTILQEPVINEAEKEDEQGDIVIEIIEDEPFNREISEPVDSKKKRLPQIRNSLDLSSLSVKPRKVYPPLNFGYQPTLTAH